MPVLASGREYCSIARALDVLGERWTLLIVRDLLSGAKRFGELERLVVGITRKWLTIRLRALEDAGLVLHEGRTYRLSAAGEGLRPAMEELSMWAATFDPRPPRDDETVVPEHDMWALEVFLNRLAIRLDDPVRWRIEFEDGAAHVLSFDGRSWRWAPGEDEADVVVRTSAHRWAELLWSAQHGVTAPAKGIELEGSVERVAEMRRLFRLDEVAEAKGP